MTINGYNKQGHIVFSVHCFTVHSALYCFHKSYIEKQEKRKSKEKAHKLLRYRRMKGKRTKENQQKIEFSQFSSNWMENITLLHAKFYFKKHTHTHTVSTSKKRRKKRKVNGNKNKIQFQRCHYNLALYELLFSHEFL